MPRITKIYTRTGDDGTTALGTTRRVPKDSPRISANGTVDELNALIGLALADGLSPRLAETLPIIQNELFHLGSDIAFPEKDKKGILVPRIETRHIESLESLQHLWVDIVFRARVLTENHCGPIYVSVLRPMRQAFVIWIAASSKA